MIELLIKLTLAHIIGDFVFQPGHWVKDKKAKKTQVPLFVFAWAGTRYCTIGAFTV